MPLPEEGEFALSVAVGVVSGTTEAFIEIRGDGEPVRREAICSRTARCAPQVETIDLAPWTGQIVEVRLVAVGHGSGDPADEPSGALVYFDDVEIVRAER